MASDDRGKLTDKVYWDDLYQGIDADHVSRGQMTSSEEPARLGWWDSLKQNYSWYLFHHFLDARLPRDKSLCVVDVGSAPGSIVINLHRRYGYVPYGIEYTKNGAELNRKVFQNNGIDPNNVIEADFFDPAFQERYRSRFDIVTSFGFIEHFSDPKGVVRKHLDLVKPGGYLMVRIPNFRYLNYFLKCFFNRDFIETHNLELMDLKRFHDCFVFDDFEIIECRYLGSFRFPEPTHTVEWKRIVERVMGKCQLMLNALFRVFLGARGIESRFFSANLICVGRKRMSM